MLVTHALDALLGLPQLLTQRANELVGRFLVGNRDFGGRHAAIEEGDEDVAPALGRLCALLRKHRNPVRRPVEPDRHERRELRRLRFHRLLQQRMKVVADFRSDEISQRRAGTPPLC